MSFRVLFVLSFLAVSKFSSSSVSIDAGSTYPKNCQEVQLLGHHVSDVYVIQPEHAPEPFKVLCNMDTTGGGWTYIMNRFNGSQNFDLYWDDYKNGFGDLRGEFWLGLENIYHLTGHEINELLVELADWDGVQGFARYNTFSIGDEDSGYALELLAGYSGNAGDGMGDEVGMKFSTREREPCASESLPAWWLRECTAAHITGKFGHRIEVNPENCPFTAFEMCRIRSTLKEARMMVRPRQPRLSLTSKCLKEEFENLILKRCFVSVTI
ncbi:fibrinogen C domain-containing protein 1-like isoform X1 [Zophobas morio]|uniref:fibrinogen C domain-containing protein 1-like isoform X1 n=2 Tax=Zophobas morio TaxID=2755281 RepID=UPI0030829BF6